MAGAPPAGGCGGGSHGPALGGRRIKVVANPQTDQDGVNLRTLQASATRVLKQATEAANTAVGDAITNHANILNQDIRTKV